MKSIQISNVKTAFEKIKTTPYVRKMLGFNTRWHTEAYHMQGMARYNNYYFFTHNDTGNDGALIYVADISKNCYIKTIKNQCGRFNHPGGCQIENGYLLTASQEHTFLTSKYEDTQIELFDIRDLENIGRKNLWESRKISSMAAAMTSVQDEQKNIIYFLMSYEGGTHFSFFKCLIPNGVNQSSIQQIELNAPDTFKGYAAKEGKNIQNFNLITDSENNIYMVEFATSGGENFIYLSKIDWDGATNRSNITLTPISYKKLSTEGNVSFDYGAGLYTQNQEITVFACGKNSIDGTLIVNEF